MKKPLTLLLFTGCLAILAIVHFTAITNLGMYDLFDNVVNVNVDNLNVITDNENEPDIRQHGDLLCVWWNFTKSSGRAKDDDVTLCTHGSIGYSKFVFDHVVHFNGFISGAFSVDNTSFPALVAYLTLYRCNPKYTETVRTHIVWWRNNQTCDSDYVLGGIEEAAANLTDIEGCNLADYQNVFANSRMSTIYKANAIRNIARIGAQSDIQLIADIENHFCDNAASIASNYAAAVRNNTAIVVRRFEYAETTYIPRNVTGLNELISKSLAFEFHHFYYKVGHTVEHLNEWLNHSMDPSSPFDLDKINYHNNVWEPQLIVHRNHPYHWERIPFGYGDQAALPHEVCRAGIQFAVGSHIFSGHRSIRRRGKYNSRRNKEGNAGWAHKMGLIYEKELSQKYPNTTQRCQKWA